MWAQRYGFIEYRTGFFKSNWAEFTIVDFNYVILRNILNIAIESMSHIQDVERAFFLYIIAVGHMHKVDNQLNR